MKNLPRIQIWASTASPLASLSKAAKCSWMWTGISRLASILIEPILAMYQVCAAQQVTTNNSALTKIKKQAEAKTLKYKHDNFTPRPWMHQKTLGCSNVLILGNQASNYAFKGNHKQLTPNTTTIKIMATPADHICPRVCSGSTCHSWPWLTSMQLALPSMNWLTKYCIFARLSLLMSTFPLTVFFITLNKRQQNKWINSGSETLYLNIII